MGPLFHPVLLQHTCCVMCKLALAIAANVPASYTRRHAFLHARIISYIDTLTHTQAHVYCHTQLHITHEHSPHPPYTPPSYSFLTATAAPLKALCGHGRAEESCVALQWLQQVMPRLHFQWP